MKPTLVIGGGGIKGVYSAGFVAGLHRQSVKATDFHFIYGTSVGGCVGAYYATEQFEEGKRGFTSLLPNRFISRWYVPDMNYLEDVIRRFAPLNIKALAACETKVYISLTEAESGKACYRCLNYAPDPIPVILAGASWLSPRMLDARIYADGCFSESPLVRMKQLGIQKIWLLSVEPFGFRFPSIPFKIGSLLLTHQPRMKRLFARLPQIQNRLFEEIEHRNDIRIIRPDAPLPIDVRGTNPEAINWSFELGVQAAYSFLKKHGKEL